MYDERLEKLSKCPLCGEKYVIQEGGENSLPNEEWYILECSGCFESPDHLSDEEIEEVMEYIAENEAEDEEEPSEYSLGYSGYTSADKYDEGI